jgi:DNA-directed RNA polymerase specialized sigma24 family protein
LKAPVVRAVKGEVVVERVRLDRSDFDEAYNMGWHGACQYIAQGHEVTNLTGLLVKITYERSLDIYRQRQEYQFVEHDLEERVVEDDLAERLDDEIKLQRLITRLKERLNEAGRQAVTLCVLHGFKRPEAVRALGIPEDRIQKIMDSATKKIAGVVAGIETRGCGGAEWSRLLRSYALGALD